MFGVLWSQACTSTPRKRWTCSSLLSVAGCSQLGRAFPQFIFPLIPCRHCHSKCGSIGTMWELVRNSELLNPNLHFYNFRGWFLCKWQIGKHRSRPVHLPKKIKQCSSQSWVLSSVLVKLLSSLVGMISCLNDLFHIVPVPLPCSNPSLSGLGKGGPGDNTHLSPMCLPQGYHTLNTKDF